jgi:hypothetical protein
MTDNFGDTFGTILWKIMGQGKILGQFKDNSVCSFVESFPVDSFVDSFGDSFGDKPWGQLLGQVWVNFAGNFEGNLRQYLGNVSGRFGKICK